MAHSMLDAVANYVDSHVFDARTASAGPGIAPPATQPLHEARARAIGPAGQAAQQMAGRAAGARPPEGGMRLRLPGGLDLPARIAPMATGTAALEVDSAERMEHAAADARGVVLHRDIAPPGRERKRRRQAFGVLEENEEHPENPADVEADEDRERHAERERSYPRPA